jgi:uncharacterized Zn finger protein
VTATVKHTVTPNPGGWLDVLSGRSGNTYRVRPLGGSAASCTCPAGEKRQPCSHVAAAFEWAASVKAITRIP